MSVAVRGIPQVMVFVADPPASARWWSEALDRPHKRVDGGALLEVAGVELFFHPADPGKNPHGASTVVYWDVDDLDEAREALIARGCEPLRGPLELEDGRRMCQLRDPFGVVWGLDSA